MHKKINTDINSVSLQDVVVSGKDNAGGIGLINKILSKQGGVAFVAAFVLVGVGTATWFFASAATPTLTQTWNTTAEWNGGTQNNLAVANNAVTLASVVPAASVSTSNVDIALNKPTVASSINTSYTGASLPASAVDDGSLSTRWGSQYSDPQWIYVDLGSEYNINEVKLNWETAYAKAYKIQVSDNATSWTTIYSTTRGTGGVNTLTGLSGTGRYIRMYGIKRGYTQYGYSLYEMSVFGTPNIALNKPTVASSINTSYTGASLPASAVDDGSLSTRWGSQYSDPQWIYVDLGSEYNINEVKLNWETAYAKAYKIQVSDNATSWTTIYSTTRGTGGVNTLTGLSGTGRYIRMYGIKRGYTQYGYSLYEMSVFGTPNLTATSATAASAKYQPSGTITLDFNAGGAVNWTALTPASTNPSGTSISYQYRTSTDNSNWSAWTSTITQLASSQYIQIQASLSTTNTQITPTLSGLTLSYTAKAATPTVTLKAASTSITSGQSTTLTWSSSNSTSCTASGSWSGSQTLSGSVSTGVLTSDSVYDISCNGSGGIASATVTVDVTAAPTTTTPAAPTTGSVAVPTGFTSSQAIMNDQFGNSSSYSLLKNWNFGVTDTSTYSPASTCSTNYYTWGQSGTAPYLGSDLGTTYDAEYMLPQNVSQTSTDDAYNNFSSTGSGLTLTAKYGPGSAGGIGYTWTSGSINTFNKLQFGGNNANVYVQVDAQMPYATVNGTRVDNGAWAGIWLLPGCGNTSEGAPYESDMIESGYADGSANPLDVVATNLHTGTQSISNSGEDLSAGYHVYGLDINSKTGTETYYLDGKEYASYSNGPTGAMFLILNVQVANSATNGWHAQIVSNSASEAMNVSSVQVYSQSQ